MPSSQGIEPEMRLQHRCGRVGLQHRATLAGADALKRGVAGDVRRRGAHHPRPPAVGSSRSVGSLRFLRAREGRCGVGVLGCKRLNDQTSDVLAAGRSEYHEFPTACCGTRCPGPARALCPDVRLARNDERPFRSDHAHPAHQHPHPATHRQPTARRRTYTTRKRSGRRAAERARP